MADRESDTNAFALRCPVWTLVFTKRPRQVLIENLAESGRYVYLFSDESLAVGYLAARGIPSDVQAAEIPTSAALSIMLKLAQNAGASFVAIDCKEMPSDALAAFPVAELLQLFVNAAPRETAVAGWNHLVRRRHSWRQQLYVKGRNMTARQLIGSMRANQLDEEKTAADFHLPVEVIHEALEYVKANLELLETEAEIERLMLKRGGVSRGPQPVSR